MNINYIAKKVLAVFAFTFVLSGCSEKKPPLIVLTNSDSAPYSFVTEKDNKMGGFDIELAKKIAKKMDREIEFKLLPFEDMIKELQARKGDFAIGAVSKSDERAKIIDFSAPYHNSGFVLLLLEDSPVTKIEDLKEKFVAVKTGSVQEKLIKEDKKLDSVENLWVKSCKRFAVDDIVDSLKKGEITAAVVNSEAANYIMSTVLGVSFKIIPLETDSVDMCIAFPKGSAYLTPISVAFSELLNDGDIDKLKEEWFTFAPAK